MSLAVAISKALTAPLAIGLFGVLAQQAYTELDLTAPTLDNRITFTGPAITYTGSDGLLHTSNVNEWPLEYDPTTARTNTVADSTFAKTSVGTNGNWTLDGSGNGLTLSCVAKGSINGVGYADWRLTGTCAASVSAAFRPAPAGAPDRASNAGDVWTASAWIQLVSGKLPSGGLRLCIAEASSAYPSSEVPVAVSSASLTYVSLTRAFTQNSTFAQLRINARGNANEVVDVTFRVYQPQLEKSASATSFIPTSGNSVTLCKAIGRTGWEARTNLCVHSQDPTAWATARTVASSNPTGGPLGTGSIVSMETTDNGGHHTTAPSFAFNAGTTYSVTVFVLPIGRSYFRAQLYANINAGPPTVNFNTIGNGTIDSIGAGVTSASILKMPNGIFKVTFIVAATLTVSSAPDVYTAQDNTYNLAFVGDTTKGAEIAVQVEPSATPGPYIPTTTSQVTRAGQVASVSDISKLRFNSSACTLFADFTPLRALDTTTNVSVASLNDGTTANRMQLRAYSSKVLGTLVINSTDNSRVVTGAYATGQAMKTALTFSTSGGANLAVNGVVTIASAGALPSLAATQLQICRGTGDSITQDSALIRRIRIYPRRLSDNELKALTA